MSSLASHDITKTRPVLFTYSQDARVLIYTLCLGAILCDPVKIRSYLYT
jgi:hypothetical protein